MYEGDDYWGKPENEEEEWLVQEGQLQALFRIAGV
jgi:hypothetical protein